MAVLCCSPAETQVVLLPFISFSAKVGAGEKGRERESVCCVSMSWCCCSLTRPLSFLLFSSLPLALSPSYFHLFSGNVARGRREHELPTKTLARSLARKWCCRRWTQKRRRCLRRKVSCVAFLHRSLLFGSLALHWYGRGRRARARAFPNKDAIIVEALALLFTFTFSNAARLFIDPMFSLSRDTCQSY